KKIGGDILEDKKTILYHLALKRGSKEEINQLKSLLGAKNPIGDEEKINKVKFLFESTQAKSETRALLVHHSQMADVELNKLSISDNHKNRFRQLKEWLMHRNH
ncbi:MAG: polyprenyl synthetase family protein, partial [Flavobacteriaceae bacterium]